MPLPRRILFVTESFGIGGTEKHLVELLPHLKESGFEVAAFCFTEPGARSSEVTAAGIEVHTLREVGSQSKRALGAPAYMGLGAARLFGLIRRFRPSIAHFFLPGPYVCGAPIAIATRVPVKVMSRRSLADYQRNWPGAAAAERRLHRHMDAITGNASAILAELKDKEGCPPEKLHLIHNGIRVSPNVMPRSEAREQLGLPGDAFIAAVVANLHPYKGHLDLIAALGLIAGELPQPWRVLCAGRDAGSQADVGHAIGVASLIQNVRLLGERRDVPLLLAASNISILSPIGNEGFSNAILESMAAGLPMVVTDVGGNAEVVVHGQTGLVVPPGDPYSLAAAIVRLAADRLGAAAMGEAGRKRILERFTQNRCVDKYEALYRRLGNEHAISD